MRDQPTHVSPDSLPSHSTFADLLADISDVLCDRVDGDGASALLDVFLEVARAQRGTLYLDDAAGRLHIVASTRITGDAVPSRITTDALIAGHQVTSSDATSAAVVAVPLRSRRRVIGVVELELDPLFRPDVATLNAIQSMADVAATTIDHVRTIDQSARLVGQLQSALDQRVVLEQAKGVIAERLGVDCRAAFAEIRNTARREQRQISDIAADIVSARTNGNTEPWRRLRESEGRGRESRSEGARTLPQTPHADT